MFFILRVFMFLRYALIFFTFGVLSAYSSIPEHHIEDIFYEREEIQLNDGSVWKVKADEIQTWQKGDKIVFEKEMHLWGDPTCFFKNLRTQTYTLIQRNHQIPSECFLHTIQAITWQSESILLEDGSIWHVSKGLLELLKGAPHEDTWDKGEHIAVMRASDLKGYYLINLNRSQWNILYAIPFDKKRCIYHYAVSEIVLDETSQRYVVTLNNGLSWKFANPYGVSIDILKNWNVGDEVVLYCVVRTDEEDDPVNADFYLINLHTLDKKRIFYLKRDIEWFAPKIEKIEKFFFSRFFLITLSDGSCWKVYWKDFRSGWQVNDRILVNPDFYHSGKYILINPDRKWRASPCLFYLCECADVDTCVYAKKMQ
jgi:hypothetical protein